MRYIQNLLSIHLFFFLLGGLAARISHGQFRLKNDSLGETIALEVFLIHSPVTLFVGPERAREIENGQNGVKEKYGGGMDEPKMCEKVAATFG